MEGIKNWQVFIHDKGMMVPGVLGKYGRAYDQLTSVTRVDKKENTDLGTKIRKLFEFVVAKELTSYMPGLFLIV